MGHLDLVEASYEDAARRGRVTALQEIASRGPLKRRAALAGGHFRRQTARGVGNTGGRSGVRRDQPRRVADLARSAHAVVFLAHRRGADRRWSLIRFVLLRVSYGGLPPGRSAIRIRHDRRCGALGKRKADEQYGSDPVRQCPATHKAQVCRAARRREAAPGLILVSYVMLRIAASTGVGALRRSVRPALAYRAFSCRRAGRAAARSERKSRNSGEDGGEREQ